MVQAIVLAALIFLFPWSAYAACSWTDNTGTVASNAVADVADCVSDASGKTGAIVVQMASASATWATPITVDMSSGFANVTGLTIQGNGVLPARGSTNNTVLTDAVFNVTTAAAKKFRLSNLKLLGTSLINIYGSTAIAAGGGFRIDHNNFAANSASRVIAIGTGSALVAAYGVIDANVGGTAGQFANVTWGSDHGGGGGNASWAEGADLGGAKAVYIENNQLTCGLADSKKWMISDATNGARIVARYNTLTDYYIGGHDASSVDRGVLQYEAHNNYFVSTGHSMNDPISFRGGTGVISNNDIEAVESDPFYLSGDGIGMQNYRSAACVGGSAQPWIGDCGTGVKGCVKGNTFLSVVCTTDADCEGVAGACQNLDGAGGYPCRDQIGRGKDEAADAAQTVAYPYLFWNNRIKKAAGAWGMATPHVDCGAEIVADRDYCDGGTTMPASCNSINTTWTAYNSGVHPLVTEKAGTTSGAGAGIDYYGLENAAHYVTPSVTGTGCSISPAVAESVANTGNSSTYTVTVTSGYHGTWSIDGAAAVTVTNGLTHQFTNVTDDKTLAVACRTDKGGVTFGTGGSGTLVALGTAGSGTTCFSAANLTYDDNESTSGSVPSTGVYCPGVTATASANSGTLAKTGSTFDGWNTAADGSGTDYAAGSGTFAIAANTTLYAKWAVVNYSVSVLNFNGDNESTTITDESGKTWTAAGDAQLDTSEKKYGTASLLLDGTGDYATTPDSADFNNPNADDFTHEAWVNLAALVGAQRVVACGSEADGQYEMLFWGVSIWGGVPRINFAWRSPTEYVDIASDEIAISTGTWYHLAVVRSGGVIKLFFHGTLLGTFYGSTSVGTTLNCGSTGLIIGARYGVNSGTIIENLSGRIDGVRISKGIARWTENFTPPAAEYPYPDE